MSVHIRRGGPGSLNSNSGKFALFNLFHEHFLQLMFLKVYCRAKTGKVEVNCYWKILWWMVTRTNHVIDRTEPYLHCSEPRHFRDFREIFLPNVGEGQKKSYHLSARPLALLPYGKSAPGYCIAFMKRLDEGLKRNLLDKTLNFTRVTHINRTAKTELMGPGPPCQYFC